MAKLSATAAAQENAHTQPTPPTSLIPSHDAAKLGHEQLSALLGRGVALPTSPKLSSAASVPDALASSSVPAQAGRAVRSTIPAAFWGDGASDPTSDSCASAGAVRRSVFSAGAHE
jgi:hypothetical protein